MKRIRTVIVMFAITGAGFVITVPAQRPSSLRGQVTDQFDAAIVGARVTLIDAGGKQQATQTDDQGSYRFTGLTAATYTLRVTQTGFAPSDEPILNLSSAVTTHNVKLNVMIETQRVNVDEARTLSIDPNNNKGAQVISGKDLEALSDDPDVLAAQLNALAGPAAGPNGTQVFVDGFTAGPVLPDKQTISQIVINQNPFSAENERIGFGSIQIFTRPGTAKLHGGATYTYSNAIFNSRNPYSLTRPGYHRGSLEGNLTGPLSKRLSYFVAFGHRDIEDTAVINATALDASLNPIAVNQAVITPKAFTSLGTRLDFAVNKNNTLSVRYILNTTDLEKQGIGGFNLESRAFDYSDRLNTWQAVDLATLNPRTINEFGFQYIWYPIEQTARNQ
ncbi:MAG TPA: carboxypeptidase-like regulatory domain-containing protein, partial [Pyrinomonadaceae bacterium]|nr:carboxypeptidase-like regulatory domain-containing protein [Pyrinomonadaceae bacterium]